MASRETTSSMLLRWEMHHGRKSIKVRCHKVWCRWLPCRWIMWGGDGERCRWIGESESCHRRHGSRGLFMSMFQSCIPRMMLCVESCTACRVRMEGHQETTCSFFFFSRLSPTSTLTAINDINKWQEEGKKSREDECEIREVISNQSAVCFCCCLKLQEGRSE